MNAKSIRRHVCSFTLFGLFIFRELALTSPAFAFELSDFLEDPLSAQPQRLKNADRLPQSSTLSCPSAVDFNKPLALGGAVDVALCNNPQARISWSQIKLQSAALGEAKSAYLPTVSGSVSRTESATTYNDNTFTPNTSAIGNQASMNFNWRLLDFGGRAANQDYANHLLAAAIAGHDAAIQKVLASVIQAYFDTLTSKAVHDARRQTATLSEATHIATRRREARGAAALSDSLQASIALAKAKLSESRAGGDYQKAVGVLKQAMGIPASTSIQLPEQIESYQVTDLTALDIWLAEAQAKHPAIKQALARWESDKSKIQAVQSEGMPTLDASAYISVNGLPNQRLLLANQTNTGAGLTINLPIFEGYARTYKIRSAQAQAELSEGQLEDTTNQVLAEVVKAHADASTSLGLLKATEQLLSAAQDAVRASQRRYERSAADIFEVLNNQAALADAQQERIRAVAEYRSARLKLLANSGLLMQIPADEKVMPR